MTPAEQTDARWARIELRMWALATQDEALSKTPYSDSERAILHTNRNELWNEALELSGLSHE